MTSDPTIILDNYRATTTGVRGGVDIDVTLTAPGGATVARGAITVAPQHDGRFVAYGNHPEHWVSGDLLQKLSELSDADFTRVLGEVEELIEQRQCRRAAPERE